MANLKDIRLRIASVRGTMQVTSAMKLVSAAKLKKAQADAEKGRPFEAKLTELIGFLGSSVSNPEQLYPAFRNNGQGRPLVVAIASDKGLAGALNSGVVKEVEALVAAAPDTTVLCLGKQVFRGLKARKVQCRFSQLEGFYDSLSVASVFALADRLASEFADKQWRSVTLVYNRFVNAAVQNVSADALLPLQLPATEPGQAERDYIVEPSREEMLSDLIPQAIQTRLLAVVRESLASEHGARMTAMHKATDNAQELLGDLQLQYNKARQSAITNELIEIVSGASALNG